MRLLRVLAPAAIFVVLLLFVAPVALAGQCSEQCTDDCTGGCSIDDPNCGVHCSSTGCSVTCEHVPTSTCTFSKTSTCSKPGGGSPEDRTPLQEQPLRVHRESSWAILRYEHRPFAALTADDVAVVSASDESFAVQARDDLLREKDEQLQLRSRELTRTDRVGPQTLPDAVPPGLVRTHLAVDLAGEGTGTTLEVLERDLGEPCDGHTEMILRVTTDGFGRIVAAQILHSSRAALDGALVRFAKENLRAWARKEPTAPIEAFLMLRVDEDRQVGVLLGAARKLL